MLFVAAKLGAEKPVTSVRGIRQLSAEDAAKGKPVQLHGVVTVHSGWKNSFFFHDGSAGISVDRSTTDPVLHDGQRITLRGITLPGSFAPIVQADAITVDGKGTLPHAPLRTAEDLMGGLQDSQWITLRGTVHSQRVRSVWGHDVLVLGLDIGSGMLVGVHVQDFNVAQLPQLVGSVISVTGVAGTHFNDRRQFVNARLFTSSLADVTVLRSAPKDPFNTPLDSLDALLRFSRSSSRDLLHVRGTVTWLKPGSGFYLQTGTKALFVEWKDDDAPALGVEAEVAGYPNVGHGYNRLQAAFVRLVDTSHLFPPIVAHPESAERIVGTRNGFPYTPAEGLLIQVDGRLVDIVPGIQQTTLLLEAQHTLYTVRLPSTDAIDFSPGALLRVSGVCVIDYDDYSNDPTAFFLQIRSLSDITVLHHAPWWNTKHAIRVTEGLAFVVVILLSVLLLSRQASLRSLATTDSLTGLCNRSTLLRAIERARRSTQRSQQTLRLLFIDVDHFKQINDVHGHRQGDMALKQVAQLLHDAFPESHAIGRIGGDEFVVVVQQTSRKECEYRIAKALTESNSVVSNPIKLSLSTGIIECGPNERASVEDLLERADMLMYKQKRSSSEHSLGHLIPSPS